ncbi:hypothetical protein [Glaciibacter psychrotolerans]|uniref:Uncharacterized protein n=1 Tax=Glaciibacter psychrotolerans TaxID=670054 RepID=A0A7Z0EFG5_9MICO|nr:hypothetical protein [Leifsonia psychrotolerans]NYJ20703.1 hypothetical protein [Leifsonia psychrotolerans]
MGHDRASKILGALSLTAIGIAASCGMVAESAAAGALPASSCVTDCTATFTSTFGEAAFTLPDGVSSLTATIAGYAGAPASIDQWDDPTSVGGPGGQTTIDLGPAYAGQTVRFSAGSLPSEGSYLQASDDTLLAVAGGGGGGGFATYFSFPDQILATYPGGSGGSPSAPGIAPGTDATAFGTHAANGRGATSGGGLGGVGTANGHPGAPEMSLTAPTALLAAGGDHSPFTSPLLNRYWSGHGGSGYTGGGSGAVQTGVDNGDVAIDLVAPGGGGSGYLAPTLTATAGAPHTGAGFVTFTWSYTPSVTIPTADVHPGGTVPVTAHGLPPLTPFTVEFDGTVVGSGVTDAAGNASLSFTIPTGRAPGTYPVQLVLSGTTVAWSTEIVVTAAAVVVPPVVTVPETGTPPASVPAGTVGSLAETGSTVLGWAVPAAVVLLVGGAATFFVGRRRRSKR